MKEVTQQAMEEVFKRIDALAAKLGVTGAYLWSVLVKQAGVATAQQVFYAVTAVLVFVISAIATVTFWRRADTCRPSEQSDYEIAASVCGGLAMLVLLVSLATGVFTNWMTPAFNPEYYALEQVFELLK